MRGRILSSNLFERGGRPRSVPDPDKTAYDEMIQRHRVLVARQERVDRPADNSGEASRPFVQSAVPSRPIDTVMADIVHVLNGPREARRKVVAGHIVRGLLDGATSAADLELGASVEKGIRKGAFKVTGSHSWRQTRKWLADKELAAKNQHVHHALIPNREWGKWVPEIIKNQPWNLKAMETPLDHIRIHGRSRKFDLPRFNRLQRYWYGTPRWWKAANGSLAGHISEFVDDRLSTRPQNSPPHPGAHSR